MDASRRLAVFFGSAEWAQKVSETKITLLNGQKASERTGFAVFYIQLAIARLLWTLFLIPGQEQRATPIGGREGVNPRPQRDITESSFYTLPGDSYLNWL